MELNSCKEENILNCPLQNKKPRVKELRLKIEQKMHIETVRKNQEVKMKERLSKGKNRKPNEENMDNKTDKKHRIYTCDEKSVENMTKEEKSDVRSNYNLVKDVVKFDSVDIVEENCDEKPKEAMKVKDDKEVIGENSNLNLSLGCNKNSNSVQKTSQTKSTLQKRSKSKTKKDSKEPSSRNSIENYFEKLNKTKKEQGSVISDIDKMGTKQFDFSTLLANFGKEKVSVAKATTSTTTTFRSLPLTVAVIPPTSSQCETSKVCGPIGEKRAGKLTNDNQD